MSMARKAPASSTRNLNELAGVQQPFGIKGDFDRLMKSAVFFRKGEIPPTQLCQTNAMLACNCPAPRDHRSEEFIQDLLCPGVNLRFVVVSNHDVHMDISISGVPKAGDW